jgi:hypothetical protein
MTRAISGSIIGAGAEITRGPGKNRLIVGDDSIIHLGDD